MTYGTVSRESQDILAMAGLLDAVEVGHLPSPRNYIEIDVVVDGALDESFEVRPEMADDVADVLFEGIVEAYDDKEIEVAIYERGGDFGNYAECLRSLDNG